VAVPVTLQIFKGDKLVSTREFNRDMIKIGRLASAHLSLDDEKVSRIHSVIECNENGSLSITDMGGVEGTFVNGKRVNKGPIQVGDEIRLGNTLIRLCNTQSATTAVAPALEVTQRTVTDVASALMQAAAPMAVVPSAPMVPMTAAAVPAPVVAPAPVPAMVVQTPAAPVQTLDAALVETARIEMPQEPEVLAGPPARARRKKKGSGPLGLEVRILWGDAIVAEHLLEPGPLAPFSVGTAAGVDFPMGDAKLGGPAFNVVTRDAKGFQLHFTQKMKGELIRKGETSELGAVIEQGLAQNDDKGYVLTLQQDDFAWVDLGSVTLEVCFQPLPKKVFVPFFESMDFSVLNIFLVLFFLTSLFVIAAKNQQTEGDAYADELSNPESRLAKLILKPAEAQKNPLLEKLAQQKAEKKSSEIAQKRAETTSSKKEVKPNVGRTVPQAPSNKDQARALTQKIFGGKGGVSALFGSGGLGGELKSAMGGLFGSAADNKGFGGMGLKGEAGGGGGGVGNTQGIGAVGTKGRAGGSGNYGEGVGVLGGKKSVDVGITASEPEVQGSLDKELIRQVIHRNRSAIAYCYSSQLQRFPNLQGKVAVKFVISGEGRVITSSTAQTTMNNADVETCILGRVRTWQFPKPKGGGVVVVTYPFIFKPSGE